MVATLEARPAESTPDQPAPPPARAGVLAGIRSAGVVIGPALLFDLLLAGSTVVTALSAVRPRPTGGPARALRRVAVLGTLATAGYALGARRRFQRWGATRAEATAELPGDDLTPRPAVQSTRAVTIQAPAETVWPWLVQFGQGRGGFYSYDWLENLAGLDIHSVDRIVPDLQGLAVGDFIPAAPRSLSDTAGWTVVRLDPERALVLRTAPAVTRQATAPSATFDAVWAFVLSPIDEHATRLIARWRIVARPRLLALPYLMLVELPHFIMERKMLLGIKRRAERAAAPAPPAG